MNPIDHNSIAAAQSPELPLVSEGQPTPEIGNFTLPGSGPGGSIEVVLRERTLHVIKGYTPEHDAALPGSLLASIALRHIERAINIQQANQSERFAGEMRALFAKGTALLLAEIDRIDFLASREEAKGGAADCDPGGSTQGTHSPES